LGATIDLADCMDLADGTWEQPLGDLYDKYLTAKKKVGAVPPVQRNGYNRLDCEVIDFAVDILAEGGFRIRTVRQVFPEGAPIYPSSAFYAQAHVQIAVRDTTAITQT